VDDTQTLEGVFRDSGISDFAWIDPADIKVCSWVRMRCGFGCALYGHRCACAPMAPSVEECRAFFEEYSRAILIHFTLQISDPVTETNNQHLKSYYDLGNRSLWELERKLFFRGYYRTFATYIGPCVNCNVCKEDHSECVDPVHLRPTPEGLGVDVFDLARKYGFPILTLSNYHDRVNSYSVVLID
jgi:predicted metal-binding protein